MMTDKILNILDSIPNHKKDFRNINEIEEYHNKTYPKKVDFQQIDICIQFLELFGVIIWEKDSLKVRNQISHYFIQSIKWYLKNKVSIFSNWSRDGTPGRVTTKKAFSKAPHFFKEMEIYRKELIESKKLEPVASRIQNCSVAIIKSSFQGKTYLLHQYDNVSKQYQLIGGKNRINEKETPLMTMDRELGEELKELNYEDYKIEPLSDEPILRFDVSNTYGALTEYTFHLFIVKFKIKHLNLDSNVDKWIPLEDVITGYSKGDGKKIISQPFYPYLLNIFGQNLSKLDDSVKMKKQSNFRDSMIIQPKVWGVGFDFKKYFGGK